MTLLDTRPGDEVIISTARTGRGAMRRLWDLGLLPGTRVKNIASHPFKGPILLKVGEAHSGCRAQFGIQDLCD